jgi:hypothetical protein
VQPSLACHRVLLLTAPLWVVNLCFYLRPTPCPRKCGASLWFQDVNEHLLICPRRLLVCSVVTNTFEKDILDAGRNGRSASELAAMVQDECGDCSSSSSSCDETDSEHEGHDAPVRRKRKPMDYTPYEKELMEGMTLEERFAFAIGREKMRLKDKATSQNPNLQLTYCFKVMKPKTSGDVGFATDFWLCTASLGRN